MAAVFPPDRLHVAGIRHLGPGSAQTVVAWLDEVRPDVIALELPADARELMPHLQSEQTQPPVALYGYRDTGQHLSALVALAEFSPEYQALMWASRHGAAVEFVDVTFAQRLAHAAEQDTAASAPVEPDAAADEFDGIDHDTEVLNPDLVAASAHAADIAAVAEWDRLYELQPAGTASLERIHQAAQEAREAMDLSDTTLYREAWMRTALRKVLTIHEGTVALVCGARHVPAFTSRWPSAAADKRAIGTTTRGAVQLSILPWTLAQLATAAVHADPVENSSRQETQDSQGAVICPSPGWFQHVWDHPKDPVPAWCVHVARTLRTAGKQLSPGHVIAAIETANQLAAVRGLARPGFVEVTDALVATFFDGNETIAASYLHKASRGDKLGTVSEAAPRNPLEVDLETRCKKLRIKRSPDPAVVTLDLRKPAHRLKSELFQQVALLGIDWGERAVSHSSKGTFQEVWETSWLPEYLPKLASASVWGTTICDAAAVKVYVEALSAKLPDLTRLYERALQAGLVDCLPDLAVAIDRQCVEASHVFDMLAAIPSLARATRYSNVRGIDNTHLAALVQVMVARVCVGLYAEVRNLDDDEAQSAGSLLVDVRDALSLSEDADSTQLFVQSVCELVDRADVPGYLSGLSLRIAVDSGVVDADGMVLRVSKALSAGHDATDKAHFVSGLCSAAPEVVATDTALIGALDMWLMSLNSDEFVAVVPYLRRTFGGFPRPARDAILRAAVSVTPGTRQESPVVSGAVSAARGPQPYDLLATWLGFELVGREGPAGCSEDQQ